MRPGSRWYAVGSDNYDRLMGSDPIGVIFSEYSLGDPSAWDYIRPILAENGGWAIFLYTPRGRNHGYTLYNMACGNEAWFCELLTIEDTKHISADDVEAEKRAGMQEDMIKQEFWCSFTAGASGAYYGELMETARKEGRIGAVPYDPQYSLEAWLDLGWDDATALWAVQPAGLTLRAVKYMEFKTRSIPSICAEIRKSGLKFDLIRTPHDGEAHEQGTGRTRKEMWEDGLGCVAEASPRPKNADELLEQINGVRSLVPVTWFDAVGCEAGIFALESYRREWDSKLVKYKTTPLHDWSSHGADAFRTGAARHVVGRYGSEERRGVRKPRVLSAARERGRFGLRRRQPAYFKEE